MSELDEKLTIHESEEHHHYPHHSMHSVQQLPHQPHPLNSTSSSSGSPTISVYDDDEHLDKILEDSAATPDQRQSHLHPTIESHKLNTHTFERASDVESIRHGLYPIPSYASQIGGEGGIEDGEVQRPAGEKDPNLVEWDGPDDKNNPYNWYIPILPLARIK